MATSKRIGLQVLDNELLNLINASTKIFPITQTDIDGNLNPNNYEFGKLYIDAEKTTYIYSWNGAQWNKIGAEDKSVDYATEVKNKPTTFTPSAHNHTKSDITDFAHTHTKADVTDFAHTHSEYSTTDHTHTGYSSSTHDHDGRYFTESEVNTLLGGKANTSHTHDYAPSTHNHDSAYAVKSTETTVSDHETRLSNIEGGYSEGHFHGNIDTLDKITYTGTNPTVDLKQIETNTTVISGKADSVHTHDYATTNHNHDGTYAPNSHNHDLQYYTESEIDTKLSGKTDNTTFNGHTGSTTIHTTQTEKDTWNAKADGNHSHTDLHSHTNKTLLDNLSSTGDGTQYLANDGTYKTVSSGISDSTTSTTTTWSSSKISTELSTKGDVTLTGIQTLSNKTLTTPILSGSVREGTNTIASGANSHAEGNNTQATNYFAHSEGYSTIASGSQSHVEGQYSTASGESSHAEGYSTIASGIYSHTEGNSTVGGTESAHAEGSRTLACVGVIYKITAVNNSTKTITLDNVTGLIAGDKLTIKNNGQAIDNATISSISGNNVTLSTTAFLGSSCNYAIEKSASSVTAHAEGYNTLASGNASHAEGYYAISSGNYTHAQNNNTIAQGLSQTAIGEYNIAQGTASSKVATDHAFIIGNGTGDTARSNALTVNWQGDLTIAGRLTTSGVAQPITTVSSTEPTTPTNGDLWIDTSI